MKRVSTFIAIGLTAFSLTLFAQSNTQTANKNNPAVHAPTRPADRIIAQYDSIQYWGLDTAHQMLSWGHADGREMDITYDGRYNMLGYRNQQWSGTVWQYASQYTFTYDQSNNMLTYTYATWNGNGFSRSSQYVYSYDANNNQLTDTTQSWSGTAWVGNSLVVNTYNVNNNITSTVNENYVANQWVNTTEDIYTYTGTNLIADTTKTWTGSWVNTTLNTYSYTANNLTVQTTQTWSGTAWVNVNEYIMTYDGNNNLTNDTIKTWRNAAWYDTTVTTDVYTGNNRTYLFHSYLDRGVLWVNIDKNEYTYDGNNNLLTNTYQPWVIHTQGYVTRTISTNTYDVNNIRLSNTFVTYDTLSGKTLNGDSTYWYFNVLTLGVNELNVENGELRVYPNPSNGQFTIQMKNEDGRMKNIEVYNLSGQEVYSQLSTLNSQFSIDLSSQPNGVYLYRVITLNGDLIGQGKVEIAK